MDILALVILGLIVVIGVLFAISAFFGSILNAANRAAGSKENKNPLTLGLRFIRFIVGGFIVFIIAAMIYDASSEKSKKTEPKVQQVATPADVEVKANFLTTLVKTPFALIVLVGALSASVIAAIIEFFANLFTWFDYGYPGLKSIWQMGWHNIVVNWWWKPAVGWHIIVAILIFCGAGGSRR